MDKKSDDIFKEITNDLDFGIDGLRDTVSIESVKDNLLTNIFEYLLAITEIVDFENEESYGAACQKLSRLLMRDFEMMNELALYDEVVSTDRIVYMTLNTGSNNREVFELPSRFRLRGKVAGFLVMDTPDLGLAGGDFSVYDDDFNPIPMQHYGVAMLLASARIEYEDAHTEYPSDDVAILVPLGFQAFPMRKVIQE